MDFLTLELRMYGVDVSRFTILPLHLSLSLFFRALSHDPSVERRRAFRVRAELNSFLVHELEEVFPILADLAIDLASVLDLAHEELLGGTGEGLDVVVRLQHHLRRNCSNKNKLGLVNFIRKEGLDWEGPCALLEKEVGTVGADKRT